MSKGRERFDIDPTSTAISELFSGEHIATELAQDILEHPPGVNRNDANLTIIDLFRLPELTDNEIIEFIEKHTGLSLSDPVALPYTLERFDGALQFAKSYLVHYLGLESLPSTIDIARVRSVEDLVAILKKTTSFQKDDRKTLAPHSGYCALVLVAFGALELEKKDMRELDALTNYVYEKLSSTQNGNPLFVPVQSPNGQKKSPVTVVVHGVQAPTSKLFMRGKLDFSLLTKILNDPAANAEESLKDGIGFRLAFPGLPKNEGVDITIATIVHLLSIGARVIELKNVNLFSQHDMHRIEDELAGVIDVGGIDASKKSKQRRSGKSSSAIQQFRILGIIDIPVNGAEGSLRIPRQFEIQFFQKDDEGHNTGTAHHDIYDVVKKSQVMTRLFGACSQEWLTKQLMACAPVQDVASAHEYIKALIAEGRLVKLPIIKERKVIRYATPNVYKRWCDSGFVSEELCRRILKK